MRDREDDQLIGMHHVDDEIRVPADPRAPHLMGAVEARPLRRRERKPPKSEQDTRDLLFQPQAPARQLLFVVRDRVPQLAPRGRVVASRFHRGLLNSARRSR
jgi:hypothetical protein